MMHVPFDMQKALAGARVVTRDGRAVSKIVYFAEAHDSYCIAASVRRDPLLTGGRLAFEIILYRADGTGSESGRAVSNDDLFLVAAEPLRYWVNLYRGGMAQWQNSEDSADACDARRGGVLASRAPRLGGRAFCVDVREAGAVVQAGDPL